MLNPILSNFRTDFGDSFFPKSVTEKYSKFLQYKKSPLKHIEQVIYESIQEISVPGYSLQTIAATNLPNLNNFGNNKKLSEQVVTTKYYPGTSSGNETRDNITVNVVFRNNIINWMYCYEILRNYYRRSRTVEDFYIQLVMMDSAGLEMFKFTFLDCFVSAIPGLTFSTNSSFLETKTFDCTFTFSRMKVDFCIPTFDMQDLKL